MRNRQQTNADNLISQNKSTSSVRTQMNSLSKESKDLDSDIKILQDTIASKNQQISDLETQILNVSTNTDLADEVGPLKYIAKLTGKSLDQVVNWFIIALMLVFDPLAIALVIAANFVFSYTGKDKNKKEETPEDDPKEPKKESKEELVVEEIETEEIEEEPEEINEDPKEEEIIIEPRVFMIGDTPIKNEEEVQDYFGNDYIEDEPVNNLSEPEEVEDEIEEEIEEPVNSDDEYEYDVFSPDFTYDGIYSPDFSDDDIEEEETEESIEETDSNEEVEDEQVEDEEVEDEEVEDGEFGGYKLGNVYKGKKSIKDYENSKDIPLDLLVTKGDPTRL
jgi:hypothetical protein